MSQHRQVQAINSAALHITQRKYCDPLASMTVASEYPRHCRGLLLLCEYVYFLQLKLLPKYCRHCRMLLLNVNMSISFNWSYCLNCLLRKTVDHIWIFEGQQNFENVYHAFYRPFVQIERGL